MKLSMLAVAAASVFATAASADPVVRLHPGDLSQPAAAARFAKDVDSAARTICFDRYSPADLDAIQGCKQAVREEAFAKLSDGQRQAFAQAMRPARRLASAN